MSPITGFLYTALSGYPVPLFMAVDLAKLVPVDKPLGEGFKLAHLSLQWLLYLTVAVHVGAAFHHHLVRKDWVLRRMMSSTEPLKGIAPAGPPLPLADPIGQDSAEGHSSAKPHGWPRLATSTTV